MIKNYNLLALFGSLFLISCGEKPSETMDKLEKEVNDVKEVLDEAVEEKSEEISEKASEAASATSKAVSDTAESIEQSASNTINAAEDKAEDDFTHHQLERPYG